MDKVVRHRRLLIGVATLFLLVILIPVRHNLDNIPARIGVLSAVMGLMLTEACLIGLVPLTVGFVGQLVLGDRELRDRVVFLYAAIAALAVGVITNSSESSLGRRVVSVVFLALLLTWFASLGATAARAVRRRRSIATWRARG
jgi:uncharacterized oligopeptide transporter (OPT) family protein